MKKHVSLIILTFNSQKYIERGFFDAYIENCRNISNYEVSFIVFDNGSIDETKDILKSKYPSIDLIFSFYNVGYCKGLNYALQYAFHKYKSKYFIISDHDAKPGKNCFKKLLNFMDNPPHQKHRLCSAIDSSATQYA